MSASETKTVEAVGRSHLQEPAAALREALNEAAHQLAGAGVAPHHLTAMTWTAAHPEAFDLSRREIDLAYREIFVGFRPDIEILSGTDHLVVSITAEIPPSSGDSAVFRDYSLAELARQYSARAQVPDMQPVFRRWSRDGELFRRKFDETDILYGASESESLDLYRPLHADRPSLVVFIHGGYWQAVSREQNAQFAAGLVSRGFAVANLDYGLCPQTPLAEGVVQIRQALNFLVAQSDALNIDASRMNLVGHSAGAYFAAMMAADNQAPAIRSVLLISGIFDLMPIALLPMGRLLGLSDDDVTANLSAANKRIRSGTRAAFALGTKESDEFKRQSRDLALAWGADEPLILGERNHFDVLDELIDGRLLELAVRLASD
jgi:arylformamidase